MKTTTKIALVLLGLMVLVSPVLAQDDRPLLLFDQAHGERFLPEDQGDLGLSRFFDIAQREGFRLKASHDPLTPARLDGVETVVISGAFTPVSAVEIDALEGFVKRGGRLAVMLHIAPPLSELLWRFGIVHTNGVVREAGEAIIGGEALNFKVHYLEPHPLFEGMTNFSLYGGWALATESASAEIVATTGKDSWVDLNGNKKFDGSDAAQPFGVVAVAAVGSGEVVVFGDDAIFQNRYLTGENLHLAENLLRFLKD